MNRFTCFKLILVIILLSNAVSIGAAENNIELKEYIESIRQQFQGLVAGSEGDTMSLNVSPIAVEVDTITVRGVNGQLKTYVINDKSAQGAALSQTLKFTVTIGNPASDFTSNYSTPESRLPENFYSGQANYSGDYFVYPEVEENQTNYGQSYPRFNQHQSPDAVPYSDYSKEYGYPDYSSPDTFSSGYNNRSRP